MIALLQKGCGQQYLSVKCGINQKFPENCLLFRRTLSRAPHAEVMPSILLKFYYRYLATLKKAWDLQDLKCQFGTWLLGFIQLRQVAKNQKKNMLFVVLFCFIQQMYKKLLRLYFHLSKRRFFYTQLCFL
eukprot:TRINITY_DN2150_c1_g1_i1.p4 TRINITY_DN2150_c1_g1~~TRINITY_DN2150_c1_g1_i1.p4  ORF type:complete len:130 (-),score=4.35 TRINITY_DN2150_c1_g1_i1:236-625(-)